MARVVVLLGPPGSGKTSIGHELVHRGFRWREWEVWILDRWGSRDEFLRVKAEAVAELHGELRRWISSDPSPAVIETTGLSDAPLLNDLDAAGQSFVVRLDVSEHEALRRVAGRDPDRHLSDDRGHNRSIWHAFQAGPATRRTDLVIDTGSVSVSSAAARIEAAVAAHESRGG